MVLRDGSTLRVRPIRPDDSAALRALHARVSTDDLRFRFFGTGTDISAVIARLVRADFENEFVLVAETGKQLVGVAFYGRDTSAPDRAEIAFVIVDALQGRGIGTRMLEMLADGARERRIRIFDAFVMADNHRMLRVFLDSGFEVQQRLEGGILHVVLSLARTARFEATAAERSQSAATASMKSFFEPKAVAVVGANRTRGKIGSEILHNIISDGYTGRLFVVHPGARSVDGVSEQPFPVVAQRRPQMAPAVRITLVALLAMLVQTVSTSAQQSRCVDCHFSNRSSVGSDRQGREAHLRNWDVSAHGRANVGCERCHGGDATTFEPTQAHRGMLPWTNRNSPLHRANLPVTCGVCHAGPFVAFQKSRHYALLRGGNPVVPTCVTCHGDAGENRPSPKALETECRGCHRPGRAAEHPEYPALGRKMLEGVRETKAMLKEANGLISHVRDRSRRARLEQAAQQVEVPLIEATQAGHAFVYDDLEERLDTARRRLRLLFDQLANPEPL